MVQRSAHFIKHDGKTGEILSQHDCILTRSEIIEALQEFWPRVRIETTYGVTSAEVFENDADITPAYVFEITNA